MTKYDFDESKKIDALDRPRQEDPISEYLKHYIETLCEKRSLKEPRIVATAGVVPRHYALASQVSGVPLAPTSQDLIGLTKQSLPTGIDKLVEDMQVGLVRKRLGQWRDYNECRASSKPGPAYHFTDQIADDLYDTQGFSFKLSSQSRSLPSDSQIRTMLRLRASKEAERNPFGFPIRKTPREEDTQSINLIDIIPDKKSLLKNYNLPKRETIQGFERPREEFSFLGQSLSEAEERRRARDDELSAEIARMQVEAEAERERKDRELALGIDPLIKYITSKPKNDIFFSEEPKRDPFGDL